MDLHRHRSDRDTGDRVTDGGCGHVCVICGGGGIHFLFDLILFCVCVVNGGGAVRFFCCCALNLSHLCCWQVHLTDY